MAVKVRCPQCSKVLNAPDAARGKGVKCPGCGSKVSVPAGDATSSKSGAAAPKTKTKAKASKSASDADFLAALDIGGVEDENIRLCPKCGAHLLIDAEECPECGVDTRTGTLSARKRWKRSQKGPDTDLFWSAAWSEPWAFIKENWGVPLKLSMMLSVFATISVFALFCNAKYCDFRTSPPPALFWMGVALFFVIGIPGMMATIMQQIVVHSMEEREKSYKAQYDIFGALANGVKYIAWAYIMPLPFAIFAGISYLIIPFAFPVAVIHMTRPYAHPAWLPWDMFRITFKNIGACLYLFVMAVALMLVTIGVAVAGVIFADDLFHLLAGWLFTAAGWLASLAGDTSRDGFVYSTMQLLLVMVFAFTFSFPIFLAACYPGVFLMRAIGEFGYYFKNRLELVNKIPKNQLAGFWPRYLAMMIDSALVTLMLGIIYGLGMGLAVAYAYMMGQAFNDFAGTPMFFSLLGLTGLIATGAQFFYFASSEASAVQGTMGMRSIGLKVTDMKGNRIKFGTGISRHFMRCIGGIPLYLGWVMCAFNEKKQTLHDITTKTLVVWEGD